MPLGHNETEAGGKRRAHPKVRSEIEMSVSIEKIRHIERTRIVVERGGSEIEAGADERLPGGTWRPRQYVSSSRVGLC